MGVFNCFFYHTGLMQSMTSATTVLHDHPYFGSSPQAKFLHAYGWLAKKLQLLFGLAEKRWKCTFCLKIHILLNLWLNVRQKALIIAVYGKSGKKALNDNWVNYLLCLVAVSYGLGVCLGWRLSWPKWLVICAYLRTYLCSCTCLLCFYSVWLHLL